MSIKRKNRVNLWIVISQINERICTHLVNKRCEQDMSKKSFGFVLVISDDNNFKMYIDQKLINSGNLLIDMEPAIIPAKEIVDEKDRKPKDWDEQEK